MTDDIWKRDEVDSPCVKVCVIHPRRGFAPGACAVWTKSRNGRGMSNADRRRVMADLPSRASMLQKRRGGRARVRKPD